MTSESKTRRAQPLPAAFGLEQKEQKTLAVMAVLLMMVSCAGFLAYALAAGRTAGLFANAPYLLVGAAGALLMYRQQTQRAWLVLAYGIWACGFNSLFWAHGLSGSTFGAVIIVLTFAGWMLGPVHAIVLTAATPPLVFLFAYLELNGWPVSISTLVTPYRRATTYSILALGAGLMGYFGALWLRGYISRTRESERKYATVFDTVPDAIAVTRLRDSVCVDVNRTALEVLGYSRAQVLGRATDELRVWFDDGDRVALSARFEREGFVNKFPARFVRADGGVIDVLVSAAFYDVPGERRIVWSWSDISELRQAERRLAESEKRYRSLFQAASDCIIVIDRDGKLLDMNDEGSRTLGYSREELLGEAFTRVLDAHLMSRLYPRPAQILVEKRSVRGEQELVDRSGKRHHVEFVASPLPDGNVLAIVRDVTERKLGEQLLVSIGRGVSAEVGEAFFHSLVLNLCTHLGADYAFIGEVLPDGKRVRTRAFVADCEARPNFEYQLEGSPCINALTSRGTVAYPDHVADKFPADAGLRRLGVDGYIGTSLLRADGTPTGILVVMSRRTIENVPLWCSVLEIFASRGAAEIERSRAEREVQELNLSLERKVAERTAELEAANRELGSFSYSVSHDLRAPLRGILGFLAVLRSEYGAAIAGAPMRYFDRIEHAALRMDQLIKDMLDLSRAGRLELKRETVMMKPLADEVAAELRQAWGARAAVEIAELPAASGDARLIRQVWENLIGNALKFSAQIDAPRIEIGGRQSAGLVEYWVQDNGAGFDMAYADKLFGVFQRLHRQDEFEGTGIGLAIVQRIVQRHGGSVSAEGQPGRGAAFRFTLPAA